MAICKRKNKTGVIYQAKVKGPDGCWDTKSFGEFKDAKSYELQIMARNSDRRKSMTFRRKFSVSEYFEYWFEETKLGGTSKGWRMTQLQMYRDYVSPVIGGRRLQNAIPADIIKVLAAASEKNVGSQTKLHIYNLLHKVFRDAVEVFHLMNFNPATPRLRPRVQKKEAKHLQLEELRKLIRYVDNRPYELAVWLQIFLGLRVSEVQALKWSDVDFNLNRLYVRNSYARKAKEFQPYTKTRKQLVFKMPLELSLRLRRSLSASAEDFVVQSSNGSFMNYHSYDKALRKYCKGAGITVISTHGLRHSTSELYQANGASRDDLRILYGHKTSKTTDGYVHDKGQRLAKVANQIRLFDDEVSQNVSQIESNAKVVQINDFRKNQKEVSNL